MASVKNIPPDKYCHSVDKKLSAIEGDVDELRQNLNKKYRLDGDTLSSSEQHLVELKDYVRGKRQILMKDCPIRPKHEDIEERPWVFPFL